MAPPKLDQNIGVSKLSLLKPVIGNKMTTRLSSRTSTTTNMLKKMNLTDLSKRKADQLSPPKGKTTKRSAFFDITNAATSTNITNQLKADGARKETVKIAVTAQPKLPILTRLSKHSVKSTKVVANQENVDPLAKSKTIFKQKENDVKKKEVVDFAKVKTDSKIKEAKLKLKEVQEKLNKIEVKKHVTEVKEREVVKEEAKVILTEDKKEALKEVNNRKSLTDESSLYASALETIESADDSLMIITPIKKGKSRVKTPGPPRGVIDFDKENLDDPFQVSEYAMDVFNYLKSRESDYVVSDYMPNQTMLTKWMRSLLVDWMVDVQEHFELNHETLYLAVKLLDIYLDRKKITKETLQLLGASTIFVASKYDERFPPAIDDILYVCENIYTRSELLRMEIEVFKAVDHCLGMPLSYRFLRRYARCCRTSMPVLTLARYILEMSLMEYPMIFISESKVACAALYLALRMKDISGWTPTLEYYSGYVLDDFRSLSVQLNDMLHRKPKEQLRTVRNKYSHTIFFEVAKTPLLDSDKL